MEIPIYIDGKQEGVLTAERQGAMTVMRAELRDVGRVVRLTVFGEKSGYLGVPEPKDGRLYLTRRLSPADMRAFPRKPEYAAERPLNREQSGKDEQTQEETADARRVLWMGGKPHYF